MKGLVLASLFLLSFSIAQENATSPDDVIDLLADPEFRDFQYHLSPDRSLVSKRNEAWSLPESGGELHILGKGWGYLRTNRVYRDYHLVLEYQWAERTYGGRADKARDGGVMVHGYGPDGAFGGMFLSSFQAQLLDGASGDLIALASRDEKRVPAPTKMKARATPDRDGEPVWNPEGDEIELPEPNQIAGRLNWKDRDPDWVDIKGWRGKNDIENPPGEWNRLEVICRGDTIEIRLNGETVNRAYGVSPSQGFVCLQSEASEMRVRRWELWPLDQFDSPWKEELRSTDTGYRTDGESILPRRLPLRPGESLASWRVPEGFELQLVACEPLVCDPVDVVWDAEGRMFVAEMRDYPLPAGDGDYLSRIRLLADEDGDGVMDSAHTWADNLDHVQGLLPMDGGLVATTRTAILFLKDSDGDGLADVRRKLFEQNEPRHNQLQVSSPRWGLDNAIYLNNGLDLKEIYPADAPDEKITVKSQNLRYDPYADDLTTVGGRGQFGGSLNNWNHRFYSTNRNPIIFAVMKEREAGLNPFAAITQVQEDIDPPGAPLKPVKLSHTTSVAHAGTYTAACGLAVYRGGLMPGMTGDIFVCDPTSQLVTRTRLVPRGASFTAERVLNGKTEFLASEDEWTRPVNLRNGPDGALYICDMYRRFIDHSRFFPEEFAETNYMRAGFDHGRIWRLVPAGHEHLPFEGLPDEPGSLVKLLEHPNAWQRIHAQRLLTEGGEPIEGVREILLGSESAEARAHALWMLHRQGQIDEALLEKVLDDPNPGVVENALEIPGVSENRARLVELTGHENGRVAFSAVLKLAEDSSEDVSEAYLAALLDIEKRSDPWMRKAILSGAEERAGKILAAFVLRSLEGDPASLGTPPSLDTVREFATSIAARGDAEELALVLATLAGDSDAFQPWHYALAEGLGAGLRRSPLKQKTLAALLAGPPDGLDEVVEPLGRLVEQSGDTVRDAGRPVGERLAALPLAFQVGQDDAFALVEQLIRQSEPVQVQEAACRAMSRFKRQAVADFFFERWDDLGPTPKREALDLIAASGTTALQLMKKMKAGEIPRSIMPPMRRWSYGRSSNPELKALAVELFGRGSSDRGQVIRDYVEKTSGLEGDPEKGKAVFTRAACITCHQVGGLGVDVGPSLADVRIKPAEALLTDILDPNRAVEERWSAYQVETENGESYAGLIASETADVVEIVVPGGQSQTIPRSQIRKISSSGMSLMPVGMEGIISGAEMADLLAFLKQ